MIPDIYSAGNKWVTKSALLGLLSPIHLCPIIVDFELAACLNKIVPDSDFFASETVIK